MRKNQLKKEEKAKEYLKKLEEKLNYYKKVVIDSNDAVIIQDFKGIIKAWNKGAEKIYGFSEKEMLGKNITKIIAKEHQTEARRNINSIKQGKPTFKIKQVRKTKENKKVFVTITYSPIYENEEIIEVATTEEDISELKKTLEELKIREHQQAALVKLSLYALADVSIFDLMNEVTKVLMQTLEVEYSKILELSPDNSGLLLRAGVGWKKEEIGHAIVDAGVKSQAGYTLLSDSPVIVNNFKKETRFSMPALLRKHGIISGMSVIIKGRDKPFGVLGAHTSKLRTFNNNDINFLQSVANLLTEAIEREKTKEELKENETQFHQFFENNPNYCYFISKDGKILNINKSACEALGYKKEEIIGKPLETIYTPESIPKMKKLFTQWLKTKKIENEEIVILTKSGEKKDVLLNVNTVYKNGVDHSVSVQQDITELKKAEETLRINEEKYRVLTESSPDCVKLFDPAGKLLFINKAGLKEHRIKSLKEALKKGWKAVESVVPEDQAKFSKALGDAMKGKATVIEIRHTEDGSIREFCEETIVPIKDVEGKVISVLGISRDIDERKKAEEEIKKINEELEKQREAILNALDDIEKEKEKAEKYLKIAGSIILTLNSRGEITMINAKGNEILGYKNGELIGKNWFDTCLPKDNLEEVKNVFDELMAGKTELVETYKNFIIKKSGEKRMIEWHNSALKDAQGNISGILSSGVDITEREETDRAKTEFVSLASHQLRTPLTAIGWCSEMLMSGKLGGFNNEQKEYIEKIHKSNARMATLINALLNVSRLELGTFIIEPARADIAKIAKSVVGEIAPDIKGKKIKFNMNFGKKLPKKIKLDINLTRIIIQNLLTNAVKYTPKGGSVFLKINKNKKDFIISVRDNGYGIPKSAQDKIFTKLFRADNIKQRETDGTGLGLYIVKSIIDHIDGKVWFKSRENKGSAFFVSIPLLGFKKKEGTKTLENINN